MALQDEMTFQRIEVLLDMQAKKINAEIKKLREELSQAKEELRKEIHARQDAFQQAGPVRTQMWADAPQMQEPQPVPRYAQQETPRYPQEQGYGQQQREKAPETRPIDRNGVAPSEVSVEKFFYMGNKKK